MARWATRDVWLGLGRVCVWGEPRAVPAAGAEPDARGSDESAKSRAPPSLVHWGCAKAGAVPWAAETLLLRVSRGRGRGNLPCAPAHTAEAKPEGGVSEGDSTRDRGPRTGKVPRPSEVSGGLQGPPGSLSLSCCSDPLTPDLRPVLPRNPSCPPACPPHLTPILPGLIAFPPPTIPCPSTSFPVSPRCLPGF